MKKKQNIPTFKTDKEAEDFLDQDLSNLDWSKFKPTKFEFAPKDKTITIRMSSSLLSSIKDVAKQHNLEYQKYIRLILEQSLSQS